MAQQHHVVRCATVGRQGEKSGAGWLHPGILALPPSLRGSAIPHSTTTSQPLIRWWCALRTDRHVRSGIGGGGPKKRTQTHIDCYGIAHGKHPPRMNQLRLDPLTGRWVVVSTDRAQRPRHSPRDGPDPSRHRRPCPFCPGNEESTPPALETYGPEGRWRVRVVPNLYPGLRRRRALRGHQPGPGLHPGLRRRDPRSAGPLPRPSDPWSMLSDDQAGMVMAAIRDRIEEHSHIPGLRYSQAIVNAGPGGGGFDRASPRPAARACPSFPASSWRNRPGSPGSPVGACCAPPPTPRRTSVTGSSTPTSGWW